MPAYRFPKGLISPADLPDLPGAELILIWDHELKPGLTVIRYGDQIVWDEIAYWEIYDRFVEVVASFRNRYGARLVDMVPTLVSGDALYGDKLGSPWVVQETRMLLLGEMPGAWPSLDLVRRDWRPTRYTAETLCAPPHSALLQSPEQLPELPAAKLVLVWDHDLTDPNRPHVVVRFGATEVWREPIVGGMPERFGVVTQIIHQKYGSRLGDLVPTNRCAWGLFHDGDDRRFNVYKARQTLLS